MRGRCGARYNRPAARDLPAFEGRGVWYWASPIEARMCRGEEVVLVRGAGLAATMSRYLIDRIAAAPNIQLLPRQELAEVEGDAAGHLAAVTWRDRDSGDVRRRPVRNLFLFIGASPETDFLASCGVALDRAGFVVTGGPGRGELESSLPGVYAVGDVRAGSTKRVGAAIGEGAAVAAALHRFLEAGAKQA